MKFLKLKPFLGCLFLFGFTYAYTQPVTDFDIYMVDVKTGIITQVSSIPDAGEFNPSLSNNGMKVVHDVVTDLSHDIYVTDVNSGVSAFLIGADGGNDASWSPNGQHIAFDRSPAGDPAIYYVPAEGGGRILIKTDATNPEWAPNSQRLVFSALDGSIRTIGLDGTGETLVVASGTTPSWSPNGQYIAFEDGGNIFRVRVNIHGEVLGSVEAVTDQPGVISGQPSWSNNSMDIVIASDFGGDFDIWTVPASGGAFSLLADQGENDEFDPSYSKSGQKVVFSGVSAVISSNEDLQKEKISLQDNFPNPFREATTIEVVLDEKRFIQLHLYDFSGRFIKTLAKGFYSKGVHQIHWDGKAEDGSVFSSGVYTYQLLSEGWSKSKRMIRLEN